MSIVNVVRYFFESGAVGTVSRVTGAVQITSTPRESPTAEWMNDGCSSSNFKWPGRDKRN